jgi:uncharacterized protein YceK
MLKKFLFVLLFALLFASLSGCATIHNLTGLGPEPKADVPEDPIEAAAMAYRNPATASLSENGAPFMAEAPALEGAPEQIRIGMAKPDVISAWGRPTDIETAGDARLGHERWVYFRGLSSRWGLSSGQSQRVVYFEGGRVAGWENGR